jgi:hypothetical protein
MEIFVPLPEDLSLVSKRQKRVRHAIFAMIVMTVFLIVCWLLI